MYVRALALGLIFLSCVALGHGSHDDADEKWDRLENLLKATFVELQTETVQVSDPAKIVFVDMNGRIYSVQKTAVAEALTKSMEINLEAHCRESHCEHHCKDKKSFLRKAGRTLWNIIKSPVVGAKEMAVQLPPTLSELAGEFGVLPATAVIVLWVPYTMLTETLESAVMGTWHWACQFFQAVYWGPVTFVFLNMASVKEAILARSPENGIGKKLWYIFGDKIREWRFSRLIKKGFVSESRSAGIAVHPGGYIFPNLNANESMTKLYKFIDSQLEAAQEMGKIGYWQRVSARFHAGRLKALLNSLRHSRWLIAHQKNRTQYESWDADAERAIVSALRSFWQLTSGQTELETFKNAVTESARTVLAYRRGECALDVALPELVVLEAARN